MTDRESVDHVGSFVLQTVNHAPQPGIGPQRLSDLAHHRCRGAHLSLIEDPVLEAEGLHRHHTPDRPVGTVAEVGEILPGQRPVEDVSGVRVAAPAGHQERRECQQDGECDGVSEPIQVGAGYTLALKMPPRTILYTGKGGVGKTSVSAATARACAAAGHRTVILSTDPAHSLSDSLGVELGPDPIEVEPGLWGQEVIAEAEMRRNWDRVAAWMSGLLQSKGVDQVRAEELSVPPGLDELFSLLQIKRHWDRSEFDVVIVDCAPSGETLRLLGYPEVASWWVRKVFPWNRSLLSKAAPIAKALEIPMPEPELMDEVEHLIENLLAMDEILRDHDHCSIRLVMNPDRMVINEARRTFTHLCLFGYLTDGVIVNRVFPEEVSDSYFSGWREQQAEQLATVEEGFSPVPVLTARFFDREVIGEEMHGRLAADLYGEIDPSVLLHSGMAREMTTENGRTVIRISAPFTEKGEVKLQQAGEELLVQVGEARRTIMLPSGLARRSPTKASFEDETLEIIFEDPHAAEV